MTRFCVDCNAWFDDDGKRWKVRCLDCWRRQKRERERDTTEPERRYQAGYTDGFTAGASSALALGASTFDAGFLRELVALCHPDRHPGRVEKATRATQRLLALLETERKAAA